MTLEERLAQLQLEEKLEGLLAQFDSVISKVSQEIIGEVKGQSQTYGEVSSKLKRFMASIRFKHGSQYEALFQATYDSLEGEKSDLPLTNRSK